MKSTVKGVRMLEKIFFNLKGRAELTNTQNCEYNSGKHNVLRVSFVWEKGKVKIY